MKMPDYPATVDTYVTTRLAVPTYPSACGCSSYTVIDALTCIKIDQVDLFSSRVT